MIRLGIEQVSHGTRPGVMLEPFLDVLILDQIHKVGQAAHTLRAITQEAHGLVDDIAISRGRGRAL